jgi:site-specific DNA recombinase
MIGIYARVSTAEQGLKGYSIDAQIEECIKKAGTPEVMKYIDSGFSGEFLERPDLERLRNDVREGLIDKIICYDPDRLARKLMNQLIIDDEFRKRGVDVIFVNGEYANTPEGQLFFSMRGAIAEFEKSKIRERTMSGRRSKAKKGKVIKNDFIYGYDFVKGELVINEEEAKVVRFIFDAFTNPASEFRGINGIALYLTEQKVPTKRGAKTWHRQVVRQILLNEVYIGRKAQNKFNTEGMLGNRYKKNPDEKVKVSQRPKEEWIYVDVPAIIDEEQFQYAQKLIGESRRRYTKTSKHTYLLSGLLRCAKCGNTMTGVQQNNWGTKVSTYTDRKNYSGAKNKGCGNSIKADYLEEKVWGAIEDYLNNPEKFASLDNNKEDTRYDFEKNECERIEKEIERTKKGRKKLMKLIVLDDDDDLDITDFKEEIRELQNKEKTLQEQYNKLKEKIQSRDEKSETSLEAYKKAMALYVEAKEEEFTPEQKQQLLRTLVQEIHVYDKEEIDIRTF